MMMTCREAVEVLQKMSRTWRTSPQVLGECWLVWVLAGVTGKKEFDDLMEKAYSSSGSDTHFLSDRVTLPGHDGSPYNGDIIRKAD